jgi:hypothetical protein
MGWNAVNARCLELELLDKARRIVCVWCDQMSLPDMWHGILGSAPVMRGTASVQFNDGEVVSL